MQTMHLFAGVGGGLLADLILGHEPIIAVEWDGYACQVLRERAAEGWFPDLRVWEGDVRMFDPSEYSGKVDCIHAGFPCQDISVAGNQAGVGHETRSGLYREVLRIAGIVRPRYLFLENVAAILGNGLGTVLADLASMGFSAEWGCIRASDCGAPHHRDRWFALAHSDSFTSEIRGRDSTNAGIGERGCGGRGRSRGNDCWQSQTGENEDVADSRHAGVCERRESVNACGNVRHGSGVCGNGLSRSCNEESEILAETDSAPSERNECTERSEQERTNAIQFGWWDAESFVGRVANGIPNRVRRLKGLGNAQVPLQAAVAWKLLGGE